MTDTTKLDKSITHTGEAGFIQVISLYDGVNITISNSMNGIFRRLTLAEAKSVMASLQLAINEATLAEVE